MYLPKFMQHFPQRVQTNCAIPDKALVTDGIMVVFARAFVPVCFTVTMNGVHVQFPHGDTEQIIRQPACFQADLKRRKAKNPV
jgi:hypothetical protein